MISTIPYTAATTLQEPAMIFLRRLLGPEAQDIAESLLLPLYAPRIQELIEPARVKRAVWQRLAKPYVTALETGAPQSDLYNRCDQLRLKENTGSENQLLWALLNHLNGDQFSPYHTAVSQLRGKIRRDHPNKLMHPATLEVGFTAARLLSRVEDLSAITQKLGSPYTPHVHAWALETFDVTYDLLRPGPKTGGGA